MITIPPGTRVRMVCADRGSTDVMHDAWAVWDEAAQAWTLGASFDAAHCDYCDGETHIQPEPICDDDEARCQACRRPESVCSADPCDAVLRERAEG